jgi:hypothetical protein
MNEVKDARIKHKQFIAQKSNTSTVVKITNNSKGKCQSQSWVVTDTFLYPYLYTAFQ